MASGELGSTTHLQIAGPNEISADEKKVIFVLKTADLHKMEFAFKQWTPVRSYKIRPTMYTRLETNKWGMDRKIIILMKSPISRLFVKAKRPTFVIDFLFP